MKTVELLSPAKNAEVGMEAIRHGADAVYIGAPRFSARAAANNAWEGIARLLRFAHLYRAKVLLALNTILDDEELEAAGEIIRRSYEMGVDALIIQDMGILRLDLPPIALHASTQADVRTPEKVEFLSDMGFQRVVLARELSLQQMAGIHAHCDVELEAFVHGSLCVSYSGQCYMSQASCGRSANRGACAQYCRLPYDLTDADGKKLLAGKHLLSLKDMDRSGSLAEMLEAGITSFKIEGRLKDADYVKNITLYYRRKLDAVLEGKPEHARASYGKVYADFTPDPVKTFHRGATEYFLHGRRGDMLGMDTPKSVGEALSPVAEAGARSLRLEKDCDVHNGDGLCFFDASGNLRGFRVNTVEGGRLFPPEMPEGLKPGTLLYRNEDRVFSRLLEGETAQRRIPVRLLFAETAAGFSLTLTDEEGNRAEASVECAQQPAEKADAAEENLRRQLSKLGQTEFEAVSWQTDCSRSWFVPASLLSRLRREAVEKLRQRRAAYRPADVFRQEKDTPYPLAGNAADYRLNIMNHKALQFYQEHGVENAGWAMESGQGDAAGDVLMHCRYCLRDALGACLKRHPEKAAVLREPLYLLHGDMRYRLQFDCRACEMRVLADVPKRKS